MIEGLILLPLYGGLFAFAGYLLEHHRQIRRTDETLRVLLKRIPVREPTEAEIRYEMRGDDDYVAEYRMHEFANAEAMNEIVRGRVLRRLRDEQRAPW